MSRSERKQRGKEKPTMELKDIVARQSAWLDTLRKGILATDTAGGGTALGAPDTQAKAIEARIADLTRQKASVIQQFDAAIARHTDALTTLKASSPATLAGNILQPAKKAK